jgi:hypothetical protein
VQVDVKDRLPGLGVAIEDRAIAAIGKPVVFRDGGRATDHFPDQPIVGVPQIVQRRDVPSRDDEDVHRRLWVDVLEGDEMLVLMDDRCRDFPFDDLAEQAISHVTS